VPNITVLFDGQCRLCRRSVWWLTKLDVFKSLAYIDFHNTQERTTVAPNLTLEELDKAMHIALPNNSFKKGFYAFREITKTLPVLWVLWPILYVPGVPFIGEKVYAYIASKRKECTDEYCKI
jgi:predicted DCC family thiol-disulfide oxidoreductase YuxK